MFLRGCENLGMPRSDCFSAKDLYEGTNVKKVLACLDSLGGLCQAKGIDVPTFGKNKYATANKREWTQAQLKAQAQSDTGTLLTQGSVGIMERAEVAKGGITFGSGSGAGTAGGTLLSSGSAGVMERVTGATGGNTFGNEAAGAGTAGGTLLNSGSAGVMERAAGHKSGITFGADQNQKPPSP